MISRTLVVLEEDGLHTRPANQFVKTSKLFNCDVELIKGNTRVPGKSLLKIMKLGIVKGDTITLECNGEQEDQAIEALIKLIQPEHPDKNPLHQTPEVAQ